MAFYGHRNPKRKAEPTGRTGGAEIVHDIKAPHRKTANRP
ncbi:hypothetical protein SFOMI_4421 [Sphingobium fuliginis]|jgi:hypothetical protein|uniref:Uncharacterized protein n=1 Tax=Sphingobium fuliginis (strain ATCC 27551) TaxID=336203 RepID=A0A292ZLU3_SPHSA|nr:hypothetical protein SFOMI_4421 [Sphingobium fuliginis]